MRSVNNSVTVKFRGGMWSLEYQTKVKRDRRRSVRVVQEGHERKQRKRDKKKKKEKKLINNKGKRRGETKQQ